VASAIKGAKGVGGKKRYTPPKSQVSRPKAKSISGGDDPQKEKKKKKKKKKNKEHIKLVQIRRSDQRQGGGVDGRRARTKKIICLDILRSARSPREKHGAGASDELEMFRVPCIGGSAGRQQQRNTPIQ